MWKKQEWGRICWRNIETQHQGEGAVIPLAEADATIVVLNKETPNYIYWTEKLSPEEIKNLKKNKVK
jgi:hypothetical protein